MRITNLIGITLITAFLAVSSLWFPSIAIADHHKPAVNYGAYCRAEGGSVHKHLSIGEAVKALRQHFQRQGLEVRHITHDNRFVRAELVDKTGEAVDSIILDSWTGRMRSVY